MPTLLINLLILFFSFISIFGQAQKPRLIIPSGHTNPVVSITLDRHEKIMATAEQTTSIKLWDIETRKELYSFNGHAEAVNDVAFSPTENLLASASDDKSIIIWNLQRAAKQSSFTGHTDAVTRVKFSLDGTQVISASFDGTIKLWNVADATLLRDIAIGNPIHSLALSPQDEYFACGTRSGDLVLFNFHTGQKIKTLPLGVTINDIQFSEDGKTLVVADNLGKVIIINASTLAASKPIQAFAYRAYKIAFTQQPGTFMVVGRDPKKNFSFYNLVAETVNQDLKLDDEGMAGFEAGINTVLFNKDKTKFYLPNYANCVREYASAENKVTSLFCGKAKPITSCSIDATGRFLAIASNRPEVLVLDLTGATDARIVSGHKGAVRSIAFHPTQKKFITSSEDRTLKIWDTNSWATAASFATEANYAGSPIFFDAITQGFYKKSSEAGIDFYELDKPKSDRINLKGIFDFRVSRDGKTIVAKSPNTLSFYASPKFGKPEKITVEQIAGFEYGANNQVVTIDGEKVRIFDATTRKEVKSFPLTEGTGSDHIKLIPQKNWAITWNTSAGKFGASRDHNLRVWDLEKGKMVYFFEGHTGAITSVEILKDKFVFSSSMDGTVRVWSLDEQVGNPYKASVIPLDEKNWVVTTGIGLFDATNEAMHTMHYVQGATTINIDQLKQTYYEPSLLPKILGYNQEPIRTAQELSELVLYPEINLLHPSMNNGKLGIELTDQGGGYGQVIIMINDKEVIQDLTEIMPVDKLKPEVSMSYSLTGHPNLKEGDLNKISVKAYNKSGSLASRPKNLYLLPDENAKKPKQKLYALLAGVSDYQGTELDLKFAAKDARDMADALRAGAHQYMGVDNTDITLLTTDDKNPAYKPNKQNIKRVMDLFAKNATANDILFIYLSGHGINYGGADGDFYYLASDAQNGILSDEHVRKSVAISSAEFTEMIKKIPAVKQVMIIDACHSGQLVSNISKNQNSISSSQVRAMETMKDKTGLYVLAGSASDAVSYEASSYGQGVLTYSLLFGIKGPALRENEFVDIVKLFQFAMDKVPQLASGIGGIQKPEVRIPSEASSFDIGKLLEAERNKIILSQPKPVFIRSEFQEETQLFDVADLSTEVDSELKIKAGGGSGQLDFSDTRKFQDGFTLRGRYVQKENQLTVKVRVFKGDKPFYEYESAAPTANELAKKIVEEAIRKATEK